MDATDALRNKKVLIATVDGMLSKSIAGELKDFDAKVVLASASPHHPNHVAALVKEIVAEKPDLVFIDHPNLSEHGAEAVIGLATQLKELKINIPLVVRDSGALESSSFLKIKPHVAKCFGKGSDFQAVLHGIAEAADQKGKPARVVS